MGVGSGEQKTMEFTFFPAAAGVLLLLVPFQRSRLVQKAVSLEEVAQDAEMSPTASIAGWSTMYPDEEEVQSAMQVFLERSLGSLQGIESSLLTTAGQLLQRTAPRWLTRQIERYVS